MSSFWSSLLSFNSPDEDEQNDGKNSNNNHGGNRRSRSSRAGAGQLLIDDEDKEAQALSSAHSGEGSFSDHIISTSAAAAAEEDSEIAAQRAELATICEQLNIENEEIRHHRDVLEPTLFVRNDGYIYPLLSAFMSTASCEPAGNPTGKSASCCDDDDGEDDNGLSGECDELVVASATNNDDDDDDCECDDCEAERDRIDKTHESFRNCCSPELFIPAETFRNPPERFCDFKCPAGSECGIEPSWEPEPLVCECEECEPDCPPAETAPPVVEESCACDECTGQVPPQPSASNCFEPTPLDYSQSQSQGCDCPPEQEYNYYQDEYCEQEPADVQCNCEEETQTPPPPFEECPCPPPPPVEECPCAPPPPPPVEECPCACAPPEPEPEPAPCAQEELAEDVEVVIEDITFPEDAEDYCESYVPPGPLPCPCDCEPPKSADVEPCPKISPPCPVNDPTPPTPASTISCGCSSGGPAAPPVFTAQFQCAPPPCCPEPTQPAPPTPSETKTEPKPMAAPPQQVRENNNNACGCQIPMVFTAQITLIPACCPTPSPPPPPAAVQKEAAAAPAPPCGCTSTEPAQPAPVAIIEEQIPTPCAVVEEQPAPSPAPPVIEKEEEPPCASPIEVKEEACNCSCNREPVSPPPISEAPTTTTSQRPTGAFPEIPPPCPVEESIPPPAAVEDEPTAAAAESTEPPVPALTPEERLSHLREHNSAFMNKFCGCRKCTESGGTCEENESPSDPTSTAPYKCTCPDCGEVRGENPECRMCNFANSMQKRPEPQAEDCDCEDCEKDRCNSKIFDLNPDGSLKYEGGMCLQRSEMFMWKNTESRGPSAYRDLSFQGQEFSGFGTPADSCTCDECEEESSNNDPCARGGRGGGTGKELRKYSGGMSLDQAERWAWCNNNKK